MDLIGLSLFEYSGLADDPLDGFSNQIANANTSSGFTPPLTTRFDGDLLIAGFSSPNGIGVSTPGLGWTAEVVNTGYYFITESQLAGLPERGLQMGRRDGQFPRRTG